MKTEMTYLWIAWTGRTVIQNFAISLSIWSPLNYSISERNYWLMIWEKIIIAIIISANMFANIPAINNRSVQKVIDVLGNNLDFDNNVHSN